MLQNKTDQLGRESELHGIPGLIFLIIKTCCGTFRRFCTDTTESFEFCFAGSEPDDVYGSGMVFYNVLFLDDELFTLRLSLFAFLSLSVPIESTNVTSIFAMLESPRRFCTSPNFCN